jgi:internalin A
MAGKDRPIQCYVSGEMIDARQLIQDVLPGALRREDRWQLGLFANADPLIPPPVPEVFVSYAWTEESSALVDRLQKALDESGIRVLRDREEVRYKDSIRQFMRRIGQGKCVVVVISEKYLKSDNCMFELLEVLHSGAFRERIFPIVLPDANIYDAIETVLYAAYWDDRIHKLEEALKRVGSANMTSSQATLNRWVEVRRLFNSIAGTLQDMNALTPEQHEGAGFEELIRRILATTAS